jgi:ribosomal subunit interface protein
MNIQYKTHDVVLADDVRALVEEKLQAIEKLLAHHDTANISCEVVLAHDTKHQSGAVYRTDLTVFAGGERTHAVGHGETLQAAIDMAKTNCRVACVTPRANTQRCYAKAAR